MIPGKAKIVTGALVVVLVLSGLLLFAGGERGGTPVPGGAGVDTAAVVSVADTLPAVEAPGYAVFVEGTTVYFGDGAALVVADVADPAAPVERGRVAVPSSVRGMAASGGYVYVAAGEAGLRVVDVRDPARPVEVASLAFDDRAEGVAASGGYVYVAARMAGLRVVDVTDPRAPREVGACGTDDQAVAVVVQGHYAHVAATYGGHRVIDVSDAARPVEVGADTGTSYDRGNAQDVAVAGTWAYLAVADVGLLRNDDVSDPTNPHWRKMNESFHAPAGVAVAGDLVYVADQDGGLRIVTYPEPRTPVDVGALAVPGGAMEVAVAGDHAYVVSRTAGLRVVDVSRPHAPVEVGALDPRPGAADVALAGGHAFVADPDNGVWVYDVARPGAARRVGRWAGRAERVVIDGTHAYVAAGTDGLCVLDVADPAAPREAGRLALDGTAAGVAVADGLAVVAAGEAGVYVVDVSRPDRPRVLATYEAQHVRPATAAAMPLLDAPVYAWNAVLAETLAGPIAYVAFDDGVRVLDLSDPARPRERGRALPGERALALVLSGGRLYAAFDDGVRVFDAADPDDLRPAAFLDTPGFARGVAVEGENVYAADLTAGLLVAGATEEGGLHVTRTVRLPERPLGLAVAGAYAFVAAGAGGLRVVALGPGRLLDPPL